MTDRTERPRRGRPVATEHESPFGLDELFFSSTDFRGVITSGNSVFQRVSKYEFDELLGHPHNLIRHPDMPRCVFRILWSHLQAGQPVAAYVKNMAKDGSWYWVYATVFPLENEYLSVRVKPSGPLFDAVKSLYEALLQRERDEESRDGSVSERREAGVEASLRYLDETLLRLGFADYDAFMRAALISELTAREAALEAGEANASRFGRRALFAEGHRWNALSHYHVQLRATLGEYREAVVAFDDLNAALEAKSKYLGNLAENVRIHALNAILGCKRLQENTETLGAVASLMRDRSNAIGLRIAELRSEFAEFAARMSSVGFLVSLNSLQSDVSTQYVQGAVAGEEREAEVERNLLLLSRSLADTSQPVGSEVRALARAAERIDHFARQVQRELDVLQVLHVNGKVEVGHVADGYGVVELFERVGVEVKHATHEMEVFTQIEAFDMLNRLEKSGRLRRSVEAMVTETHAACGLVGV